MDAESGDDDKDGLTCNLLEVERVRSKKYRKVA